jgi:predicted nucleic acid-binding protein
MNVIDSSGWLEYFTDGPNTDHFKPVIEDEQNLIIPTICLYEVFKVTLARAGEDEALRVAGLMSFGMVVELGKEIALAAAQVSIDFKLAMADSIIYATAQRYNATLWTQDEHFKDMPGVQYTEKSAK